MFKLLYWFQELLVVNVTVVCVEMNMEKVLQLSHVLQLSYPQVNHTQPVHRVPKVQGISTETKLLV